MKIHEKIDVVIVGAGASGSVYAALLAEAGKSVLVLEKGARRKLTDLYSSQIWARRLKWGSPHVETSGPNSVWYNFNAGQGYGGSAIHHFGVWPRYHPEDMHLQTLYGRAHDWPLSYADLNPYYDRVMDDVGLSGDIKGELWRKDETPYPLPPVIVSEHGQTIANGFEKLGLQTHAVPMAILSREYKGRPGCIWDGWCAAGCPTGALANPLVVYLPRATAKGAVLQPNSMVTKVRTNDKADQATGVEYFDAKGGQHFQPADMVVLAAFSIENPRILLNSVTAKHKNGLANSSGLVGKYLMSHASISIFGMFGHEMDNYLGVSGGQLINQDHFTKDKNGDAFGSRQWIMGTALKPNDLLGIAMTRPEVFGAGLDDFMKKAAHNLGTMVSICEEQPVQSNRIELSTTKDKFGMPLAQVNYTTGKDALGLLAQSKTQGFEIFKAAGADKVWSGPPAGQHIMGGTIMGDDRTKSVTNSYAQTHDIPNLVIGGCGIFPTSSCANPTYTIHALAMRSAQHLINNWPA